MRTVTINQHRCDRQPGCPARLVCPKDAIVMHDGAYTVDEDKCSGCGVCARVCPMGAVELN